MITGFTVQLRCGLELEWLRYLWQPLRVSRVPWDDLLKPLETVVDRWFIQGCRRKKQQGGMKKNKNPTPSRDYWHNGFHETAYFVPRTYNEQKRNCRLLITVCRLVTKNPEDLNISSLLARTFYPSCNVTRVMQQHPWFYFSQHDFPTASLHIFS